MTTVEQLITDAYRESNITPVGEAPSSAEQTEGLGVLNRYVKGLFGYELGELMFDWEVPSPQRTASVAAQFPFDPPQPDMTSSVYLYPPSNARLLWGGSTATTVYFPERPSDGAQMGFVDQASTAALTLDGNGKTIDGRATVPTNVTITMTIAVPGVVTWTSHGLRANDPVRFSTSGALPTGVEEDTTYYVLSTSLTTDTFKFSDEIGGSPITTTGSQSGTHKGWAFWTGARWLYRADLGDWVPIETLLITDDSPLWDDFDDLLVCATNIRLCPRNGLEPSASTVGQYSAMLGKLKARCRQITPATGNAADIPNSVQTTNRWNDDTDNLMAT